MPYVLWRKVAAAQETLNAQAQSLMKAAIRGAKLAAKQGKVEPAIELLKHTAAFDDAGKERRPLAASVDRPPRISTMASGSFRSESDSALTSTPSSLSRFSRRSKRSTCPRAAGFHQRVGT